MPPSWWTIYSGRELAQGDLLADCRLPIFWDEPIADSETIIDQEICSARLIILSQSCDLENKKLEFVALCPIHTIFEFQALNPEMAGKGKLEELRKGRREGLHLLASTENPSDNQSSLIADFGQIVSLPFAYLVKHAENLGDRHRLNSPYLEHFSQAFARFFMRVGLPSSIPPFK